MSTEKVVVITGAGLGIGYSLSQEYASKGYRVFALDIKYTEEHEKKLKEVGAVVIVCDVSNLEAIATAKETIINEHKVKRIDVLYNNAGIGCSLPATDLYEDALVETVNVNLLAPIRIVREFHKYVVLAKGTIVFTTSVTGTIPLAYLGAYAATKAGLDQYAQVLNLELSPLGVKVISLVSGAVDTNITSHYKLPENSIFNTKEAIDNINFRRQVLKMEKGMAPDVYAKRAVAQLDNVTVRSFRLFEGSRASCYFNMFYYMPTGAAHNFLRKRYKINGIYDSVKARLEKEIVTVD